MDEKFARMIVLEESRNQDYFHPQEPPASFFAGKNPSCGDDLGFYLKEEPKDQVSSLSYQGHGCAISKASSSLMCQLLEGKSIEESLALARLFIQMIQRGPDSLTEEEKDRLGDAMALEGVANMPARAKCATLPWHTLLKEYLPEEAQGMDDDLIPDDDVIPDDDILP